MLTKTSMNILKILVSKGIFEDVYDGANIIISLVPFKDGGSKQTAP